MQNGDPELRTIWDREDVLSKMYGEATIFKNNSSLYIEGLLVPEKEAHHRQFVTSCDRF